MRSATFSSMDAEKVEKEYDYRVCTVFVMTSIY